MLRVGDEVMQAHFLDQVAGFHVAVGEEHNAHQHRQQENMHHIQHPGAAQDFHAGNQKSVARQDLAVGQDGRITGEKNENFRSIAEAEITQGDLTQRVVGHVIPENEDQRQAPEKVDSVIAFSRHGYGLLNGFEVETVGAEKVTRRTLAARRVQGFAGNCKAWILRNVSEHRHGTTASLKAIRTCNL
ncbi:hypothetical protein EMIT0P294_40247 [Pseudomonas sp. IT-P294]